MDEANSPIGSSDTQSPRPAARLFILLAIGAVILGLLWVLVFSAKPLNNSGPEGKSRAAIYVPKGINVSAILLTSLQSDGSTIGQPVRLVVAKNAVGPDGSVVIQAGATLEGEVTKVRGAGALSGLMNSPARLEIQIKPLQNVPVDYVLSEPIQLGASGDGEVGAYAFGRDNTGDVSAVTLAGEGIDENVTLQLLNELANAIEKGEAPPQLAQRLASNEDLLKLMDRSELSAVKEWTNQRESAEAGFDSLLELTRDIKQGRLTSLAAPEVVLALGAIQEIGGLAIGASNKLKGIVKGRNIRAHIGTQVELITVNDVTLNPRSRTR